MKEDGVSPEDLQDDLLVDGWQLTVALEGQEFSRNKHVRDQVKVGFSKPKLQKTVFYEGFDEKLMEEVTIWLMTKAQTVDVLEEGESEHVSPEDLHDTFRMDEWVLTVALEDQEVSPNKPVKEQVFLGFSKPGIEKNMFYEGFDEELMEEVAIWLANKGKKVDELEEKRQEMPENPEVGEYDIDMVESGVAGNKSGEEHIVKGIIEEHTDRETAINIEEVLDLAEEEGVERQKTEEIINRTQGEGNLFEPKEDYIQPI